MHELSLCLDLAGRLQTLAREHGALSVRCVHLRVGALSGVEPSLLEQAFGLAMRGTKAEGARLVVKRVPVEVRCLDCGKEGETPPFDLRCPSCRGSGTVLLAGRELVLDRVEMDVEEERHV